MAESVPLGSEILGLTFSIGARRSSISLAEKVIDAAGHPHHIERHGMTVRTNGRQKPYHRGPCAVAFGSVLD